MTGKWVEKLKGNWTLFALVGSSRDLLSSSGFSPISVEVG